MEKSHVPGARANRAVCQAPHHTPSGLESKAARRLFKERFSSPMGQLKRLRFNPSEKAVGPSFPSKQVWVHTHLCVCTHTRAHAHTGSIHYKLNKQTSNLLNVSTTIKIPQEDFVLNLKKHHSTNLPNLLEGLHIG